MVYVMLVETITNVILTVALILIKTVLIKCQSAFFRSMSCLGISFSN